jgi:hypothetical protein
VPLLDAVATYLAGAGIGLTVGTNLFKATLPDSPDVAVAIFEWGGQANEKTFAPLPGMAILERPVFQVLVRGARENVTSGAYSTARAMAESIYRKLDGYVGTLSGVAYKSIVCESNPYYIQTDDNARPHIGMDFQAVKELG